MTVPQVSQPVKKEITQGMQQPHGTRKRNRLRRTIRGVSGVISGVSGISGADSMFFENEPATKKVWPAGGTANVKGPAGETTGGKYSRAESSAKNNEMEQPASFTAAPEHVKAEMPGNPSGEAGPGRQPDNTPGESGRKVPPSDISFTGSQWLDLLKWAHHSGALTQDQRQKIVRMGRLIQKDRKLTKRQQDQVREILSLVHSLGYNSP